MRVKQLGLVGCIGIAVMLASQGAWAVYRCESGGRVSFQDAPCGDGQKASEISVTPSSQGVNPAEGSKPSQNAGSGKTAPASSHSAPADQPAKRPADCPSAAELAQMGKNTQSVALPLAIREMQRKEYEALKDRCGG